MNFCATDSDSAKIAACASVATFNFQSNAKFSLRFFRLCFMFCGFFPCFVDYEDNLPLTMYKLLKANSTLSCASFLPIPL